MTHLRKHCHLLVTITMMTQANQSEGISPELEEKIHEMQVKSPSGCPNFIGCSRSWKSSCRLCQRTRTTSSRCCLKAPSRQPADQVLKGVVDVPLLLGLRGDHQRLPRPSGVRVRQRGVRGRTRGTGRDLDVSILLPCLHHVRRLGWFRDRLTSLNAPVDAS